MDEEPRGERCEVDVRCVYRSEVEEVGMRYMYPRSNKRIDHFEQ